MRTNSPSSRRRPPSLTSGISSRLSRRRNSSLRMTRARQSLNGQLLDPEPRKRKGKRAVRRRVKHLQRKVAREPLLLKSPLLPKRPLPRRPQQSLPLRPHRQRQLLRSLPLQRLRLLLLLKVKQHQPRKSPRKRNVTAKATEGEEGGGVLVLWCRLSLPASSVYLRLMLKCILSSRIQLPFIGSQNNADVQIYVFHKNTILIRSIVYVHYNTLQMQCVLKSLKALD